MDYAEDVKHRIGKILLFSQENLYKISAIDRNYQTKNYNRTWRLLPLKRELVEESQDWTARVLHKLIIIYIYRQNLYNDYVNMS